MIQFILKVILSIFTGILDCLIAWMCALIAFLLWETRWCATPMFIFTRMLWNKNMTVTENN